MTANVTRMQRLTLARRVAAETVGTALLLAAVVGSGIMGERLAGGNVGLALLANTVATGAALVALILAFWPDLGSAFQPGGDVGRCISVWHLLARGAVLHLGPDNRGLRGRRFSTRDVRRTAVRRVSPFEGRHSTSVQRVRCDIRPACRDLGLRPLALVGDALRRRGLHHRSLLVHGVNVIRKPSRDAGTFCDGHLYGHSPLRCSRLHQRPTHRRRCSHRSLPMVGSYSSRGGTYYHAAAFTTRPQRTPQV